jgi:hypothetical protein
LGYLSVTSFERLASDKRSSLFVWSISDEEENFNKVLIKNNITKLFLFVTGPASK